MIRKIILQAGLWLTILVINLAFMAGGELEAVLFELLCVVLYALVFYLNILYLFPKTYVKSKIKYWLSGILLMGFVLLIIEMISESIWGSHRHHRDDWLEVVLTFRQALWLFLIFMIGTVYSIQEMLNKQIIHQEKILEEKLKTELQLLKVQINPHFLFNALNNIYSLTYMKSEKAPDSVLKLSEMLRYVLDDCSSDKVPLRNEISYIRNFMDFYKMKSPGKRNIKFTHTTDNMGIQIAPMIFIPFIENSFKYSRIEEDKSGFINISLSETAGKIIFKARNSVFSVRPIMNGAGKGIANVKQRLEIIYPGKYFLRTGEENNEFIVELELDLG